MEPKRLKCMEEALGGIRKEVNILATRVAQDMPPGELRACVSQVYNAVGQFDLCMSDGVEAEPGKDMYGVPIPEMPLIAEENLRLQARVKELESEVSELEALASEG